MEANIEWYIKEKISRTIKNFKKNSIEAKYFEDRKDLLKEVKTYLFDNCKIGCGDSITLEDLGLFDLFRDSKYRFNDKYQKNLLKEEKKKIYRDNFSADLFFTGTNAITEKGEIFNIDGNGSRVAPMIYGPDKVIIIVGLNKLVKDLEEASKRVRNYSAPIDAKRLDKKTPCIKTGMCFDCSSPERICNSFVTITSKFDSDRIKVFILNESLGY